jgi:UDP-D-galactose:(glucosyl)LPS alpha-1,6-D-galactosyltransferase
MLDKFLWAENAMEVKVICHNLSGTGGTETVLVKVLNHLSKFHNIQLVLPNKPDNTEWLHNLDSNIQVRMLNKNGKLSKIMFFLKTFLKTTDDTVLLMLGANMIKFAAKVREVFHKKYGIISWIHFSLFDQQMFDPKNIRYADQHWAISTKISKQLQSLGIPDSKIRLIYNPITPAKILSADSEQKDVCHLVYIGRIQFEGQKNLKELFDALGKVHKPVFIDLYGAGADVQRCQEYCKIIGIEKNVRWHGWVNDPWQEIESSPDAIVLSSRYEGLPMVMLEAASRGIPMIVSQFEGYTDILQENINGYSYAIGNSDQLAEKIDKLSGSNINAEQVVDSIKKFYENEYFARLDKILS